MSNDTIQGQVVRKRADKNKAVVASQKAKVAASRQVDSAVVSGTAEIRRSLLSKQGDNSAGATSQAGKDYEKLINDLENKQDQKLNDLANGFKDNAEETNRKLESLDSRNSQLSKQNSALGGQIQDMGNRFSRAFDNLAKQGAKQPKDTKSKTGTRETPGDPSRFGFTPDPLEYNKTNQSLASTLIPKRYNSVTTPKRSSSPAVDVTKIITDPNSNSRIQSPRNSASSESFDFTPQIWSATKATPFDKSLKIQGRYKVGNHTLRITNLFGLRVGENNVSGRTGKHSNGIDYVDSNGGAIAIDDGVITRVHVSGSRSATGLSKQSGGYIVTIQNEKTGLSSMYMHMDQMTDKEMKDLKGKKVHRGDKFWTAKVGSGSMSAPHVKVTQYMNISKFNTERSQYNPSKFIVGRV